MSCLSQEASTRLAVTLKHPSRSDPIRHPNPILRRELVADFNQSIRHGRNNHDQQPSQLRATPALVAVQTLRINTRKDL